MLAAEFGEVSLRHVGDKLQVAAALAMGAFILGDGESCRIGLALDASQSMIDAYGRGKTLSSEDSRPFFEKGMYKEVVRDGVTRRLLNDEAKQEVKRLGLVKRTQNIVHQPVGEMIASLISNFAPGGREGGSCEVVYWACGAEGKDIEQMGALTIADCKKNKIQGPLKTTFGPETHLAPPFKHFAEQSRESNGVFVFVTDGCIDDEAEVIALTHKLAAEIENGSRPSLKCILLGVGRDVDVDQFNRIDDMEMPADLASIDIWNSKVLAEMRDMTDAFSEIFNPDEVVATSVQIFNDQGEVVTDEQDEVKALISFEMPAGSHYFEMLIDGEMKIRQTLPK